MAARGDAILVLGTDDRWLQQGLGASQRRVQTWGRQVAGDLNRTMKRTFSNLTSVAGFAGVGLFAAQARQIITFENGLSQLGVSARLTQYQMGALGEKIRDTAVATGISAEQILSGIQAYVALTGDVRTASASMETFARAAQATSTPIEEIAKTAAALSMNLGITSEQMEAALSGIHSQGKEGAVEFKEMAMIVSGLAPRFAQFNTVGVKGLAEMNGILQTMRVGFGTTSEAATSLEAVMGALTDKENVEKLAAIGVKAFTTDSQGVRHMRDLRDILVDVIAKTKGDPITISKIFGRKEAIAGIVKLAQAGAGVMDRMIGNAARAGEIGEDFDKRLASPAVRLAQAKEKLDRVFSEELVKHLDAIVDAFGKLVELIDWMIKHKVELIAMFAALKGGEYLAGLAGGGLAGGMGGVGSLGRYAAVRAALGGGAGAATAGRLALAGGIIQGAGVAYGTYQLAGAMGMDAPGQIFTSLMAGLGALPGPLGLLGKAATLAAMGVQGLFDHLNSEIDERQRRIAEGRYGQFGMRESNWFEGVNAGVGKVRAAEQMGVVSSEVVARTEAERNRASHFLIRTAKEVGALTPHMDEGQFSGKFDVNERVLRQVLENEDLNSGQQEQIVQQTLAALKVANEDREVGDFARGLFGIKAGTGGAIRDVRVSVGIDFVDGKPVRQHAKNDRRALREGR